MAEKAYIGIRPCGCVTFAQVVGTVSATQEKRDLAKVARSGRKIEVVSSEEAQKRFTSCPHSVPIPAKQNVDDLVKAARA